MTRPFIWKHCALAAAAALLAVGAQAQQAQPAQTAPAAQQSTDQNVPPAVARQQANEIARGDPARWYQEDTSEAARRRTLHKEIGAALQEAQGACKAMAAQDRAACLKEARATYQQEMAALRSGLPR